eukprot:Rhum_TRINITY_DN15459_c2_g1::Rhum_TRINITY_DN15459_c2_g1_i3::g.160243::m.160243
MIPRSRVSRLGDRLVVRHSRVLVDGRLRRVDDDGHRVRDDEQQRQRQQSPRVDGERPRVRLHRDLAQLARHHHQSAAQRLVLEHARVLALLHRQHVRPRRQEQHPAQEQRRRRHEDELADHRVVREERVQHNRHRADAHEQRRRHRQAAHLLQVARQPLAHVRHLAALVARLPRLRRRLLARRQLRVQVRALRHLHHERLRRRAVLRHHHRVVRQRRHARQVLALHRRVREVHHLAQLRRLHAQLHHRLQRVQRRPLVRRVHDRPLQRQAPHARGRVHRQVVELRHLAHVRRLLEVQLVQLRRRRPVERHRHQRRHLVLRRRQERQARQLHLRLRVRAVVRQQHHLLRVQLRRRGVRDVQDRAPHNPAVLQRRLRPGQRRRHARHRPLPALLHSQAPQAAALRPQREDLRQHADRRRVPLARPGEVRRRVRRHHARRAPHHDLRPVLLAAHVQPLLRVQDRHVAERRAVGVPDRAHAPRSARLVRAVHAARRVRQPVHPRHRRQVQLAEHVRARLLLQRLRQRELLHRRRPRARRVAPPRRDAVQVARARVVRHARQRLRQRELLRLRRARRLLRVLVQVERQRLRHPRSLRLRVRVRRVLVRVHVGVPVEHVLRRRHRAQRLVRRTPLARRQVRAVRPPGVHPAPQLRAPLPGLRVQRLLVARARRRRRPRRLGRARSRQLRRALLQQRRVAHTVRLHRPVVLVLVQRRARVPQAVPDLRPALLRVAHTPPLARRHRDHRPHERHDRETPRRRRVRPVLHLQQVRLPLLLLLPQRVQVDRVLLQVAAPQLHEVRVRAPAHRLVRPQEAHAARQQVRTVPAQEHPHHEQQHRDHDRRHHPAQHLPARHRQPDNQKREHQEHRHDVREREPPQVRRRTSQELRHVQGHHTQRPHAEPQNRSETVEEHVLQRHPHALVHVAARQRRQHARHRRSDVRSVRQRHRLLNVDQAHADQRRQRRREHRRRLHKDRASGSEQQQQVVVHASARPQHRVREVDVQQVPRPDRHTTLQHGLQQLHKHQQARRKHRQRHEQHQHARLVVADRRVTQHVPRALLDDRLLLQLLHLLARLRSRDLLDQLLVRRHHAAGRRARDLLDEHHLVALLRVVADPERVHRRSRKLHQEPGRPLQRQEDAHRQPVEHVVEHGPRERPAVLLLAVQVRNRHNRVRHRRSDVRSHHQVRRVLHRHQVRSRHRDHDRRRRRRRLHQHRRQDTDRHTRHRVRQQVAVTERAAGRPSTQDLERVAHDAERDDEHVQHAPDAEELHDPAHHRLHLLERRQELPRLVRVRHLLQVPLPAERPVLLLRRHLREPVQQQLLRPLAAAQDVLAHRLRPELLQRHVALAVVVPAARLRVLHRLLRLVHRRHLLRRLRRGRRVLRAHCAFFSCSVCDHQ